jgi:hypothetical protein
MRNRTQKEQMEEVLRIAGRTLGEMRKNPPAARWNWWGSGALLNADEGNDWENSCRCFKVSIKKAQRLLSTKGEYNQDTIDWMRCLIHDRDYFDRKYCGVR